MHPILLLLPLAIASADASPLTLDEALAAAAKSNVDLLLSGTDRDAAGVEAYASWSGILPRLDVQAVFENNYNSNGQQLTITPVEINPVRYEKIIVTTPSSNFENYTLVAQLTMPLFDGFKSWANISRFKLLVKAADKQYDDAALNVAFDVISRFYDLVRAERSLKVLEEAVARSEVLVRRTDELYQAGRAPRSETYAARVTLGNDRISAEQQRSRLADARVALSLAVGRGADPTLEVLPPAGLDRTAFVEPLSQESLVELAKRKRPLLGASEQRILAAGQEIRAAASGYWPSLQANASYGRQSPWLAGTYGVYGDFSQQFGVNVGVTLTWNLFEGRLTSANVQRANVSERRAQLQAEQALLQVTGQIARSRASYLTLSASAALAEENLKAAEENLKLAERRYDAGAGTQVEVRDALLNLTRAQLTLLTTRIDAIIARADLNRAVGGAL
jgi:outer membrane protein TolC